MSRPRTLARGDVLVTPLTPCFPPPPGPGTASSRRILLRVDRAANESSTCRYRAAARYVRVGIPPRSARVKVATWNVNGIRAREAQVLALVDREKPDVLCLQEIKAPLARVPPSLCDLAGYVCLWHGATAYS